jgi:hypothetical protein
METLQETLATWRATKAQRMRLEALQVDPALQPREERLVPFKGRGRYEDLAADHVGRMRHTLEASKRAELEPLLVAEIDGQPFVVDGHHRMTAYRAAKRKTVPVRVRPMSRHQAALLSKLVNLDGVKLPLHAEQARDAAWQYIAHLTKRGTVDLPSGESTRTIAGRFGIGHDTVARMLHKIPTVELREFNPEACDAGTGWPRWKYVKDASRWADQMPPAERLQRRAERTAKRLAKLKDSAGAEVFQLAVALLLREADNPDPDTLAELDRWARDGADDF